MCTGIEPVILAAATVADSLAQGAAARREAGYRAAILDRRAARAEQEAAYEAANLRRRSRRMDAALRARLAASGIDAGLGSPLLARETLAAEAELDALAAIGRGEAVASDARAAGALARFRGDEAARRAGAAAGRALLRVI
jgi:hypothetical protein